MKKINNNKIREIWCIMKKKHECFEPPIIGTSGNTREKWRKKYEKTNFQAKNMNGRMKTAWNPASLFELTCFGMEFA